MGATSEVVGEAAVCLPSRTLGAPPQEGDLAEKTVRVSAARAKVSFSVTWLLHCGGSKGLVGTVCRFLLRAPCRRMQPLSVGEYYLVAKRGARTHMEVLGSRPQPSERSICLPWERCTCLSAFANPRGPASRRRPRREDSEGVCSESESVFLRNLALVLPRQQGPRVNGLSSPVAGER